MRKPDRFKLRTAMAMAVGLVLCGAGGAWAQIDTDVPGGHIKLQTSLETDWGWNTSGEDNRNNNNNKIPGSGQAWATDNNAWQAMIYRVDPLLTYRLNSDTAEAIGMDNADLYIHGRFYSDIGPYLNGGPYPNLMGTGQRYPGDAWSARVSEHEYEADAAEAYIDLRKGPWALRLGKQQIVYGEELGMQTLDQVDSLDFTKAAGFEIASLEFSDLRIGEWTAKLSYQLPDFAEGNVANSLLTGFISPDFQPDYLYPAGWMYNNVPAFEKILSDHGVPRARHKLVYGAVLTSTVYGVDLSANFYSTPEHFGWFKLAGVKVDPDSGLPAVALGIPALGTTPIDLLLDREFSRIYVYGGSASYTMPSFDFPGAVVLNGDVFHASAAYTPDKAFFDGNLTGHPIHEGEINTALDVEKYTRFTREFPSTYLLLEWNFRSRSDLFDDYMPLYGHHNYNLVVISLTQPLPNNIWSLGMVAECETNTGGNWFLQPSVTYKPTSAQEYDLYWNFDEGTALNSTTHTGSLLGTFSWVDAVFFRAVYKM